jgi:hypothetical protein
MGTARRILSTGAAALAIAQGVVAAHAQGALCVDLESRLVALNRGAAAPGMSAARQYDQPVAQQQYEIDRAVAEARRAGCIGGFLIFRPRPAPKCGELMATIDRMRANLQRLQTARGRAGGDPFTVARERNRLLQALNANRCGREYAASGGRGGGLLDSLFGQARFRTWGEDGFFAGSQYGTYRTLCVRTCDGYYFPISFSTLPGQFPRDQQTCQAMCPGAEVTLYTHRNPGEETSQMVSLGGAPYTALPTAFRYREEFDAACTCHAPTLAGVPAADPLSLASADRFASSAPVVPLPSLRPVAGEDPETTANRAGQLVPRPAAQAAEAEVAAAAEGTAPTQRQIRIVGPAYYYGQ